MRSWTYLTRRTLVFSCLFLGTSTAALPEQAEGSCSGDDVSLNQWLPAPVVPDADQATRRLDETPLDSPSATQVAATGGDATSLVLGAAAPTLLALAAEKGLASTSDGRITVNLSPFDLIAVLEPDAIDRQSRYEEYGLARRFGLAVTLGGEGDSFDRDGDGEPDEALEAKDLQDVVSWEARVRLMGTRDRRDKLIYRPFFDQVNDSFVAETNAHQAVLAAVLAYAAAHPDEFRSSSGRADCFPRAALDKARDDKEVAGKLGAYAEARASMAKRAEEAAARADGAALLSLVLGGLERGDDFGPDKRMAGLRGAWGGNGRALTWNLEWNEIDSEAAKRPRVWKAGLEYSVLILKGRIYKDGIQVAGSGVYERYENVPDAKHDNVARLGAKLELPVGVGVKIPISITWANHADLIEGESETRGHIGFAFDLSQIKKPDPG